MWWLITQIIKQNLEIADVVRKLFILVLIAPYFAFGQSDSNDYYPLDHDNPPWKLPCDSLFTQAQMNTCSGKKCAIADSIMNDLLTKNLNYYRDLVQLEGRSIRNDDSTYYKQYEATLSHLNSTQQEFKKYRTSLVKLEGSKWAGGSIRPLMVNLAYLNATIDRIKWLEALLEENLDR